MSNIWFFFKKKAALVAVFFVLVAGFLGSSFRKKKRRRRYRDNKTKLDTKKVESLTGANQVRKNSRVTEEKIKDVQQQIREIENENPTDESIPDLVNDWNDSV